MRIMRTVMTTGWAGIITRRYPSGFGIRHYKQEEWYAQFLWPIFKSRKAGSELARGGPMVVDEVAAEARLGVGRRVGHGELAEIGEMGV